MAGLSAGLKRLALVVAGAHCVWDDVLALLAMAKPDTVLVINDMIPRWPGTIDHAVSLHPDNFERWLPARAANGLPPPDKVWSHRRTKHVTHIASDWLGSSGLFAVKIAIIDLGFAGVVACGMPMDDSPHFGGTDPWPSAHAFKDGWKLHMRVVKRHARSMAGWTREQLGGPTPEWLASIGAAPPDPALIDLCTNGPLHER